MKEGINSNGDNKCILNEVQKEAIDKALEDVVNEKVYSHQDVMEETKKCFSYSIEIYK